MKLYIARGKILLFHFGRKSGDGSWKCLSFRDSFRLRTSVFRQLQNAEIYPLNSLTCFRLKHIAVCLFVFAALIADGRTFFRDSLPDQISSTITHAHVNIPGTKVYIVPPEGFVVAKNFVGLHNPKKNAAFQVYDMPGENFYVNAANYDRQAMEAKGATVYEYKKITINGYDGKMIFYRGSHLFKTYSIVFGDSTFSIAVVALFPSGDSATGNKMRRALSTIVYDKNMKVDPFDRVNYRLDDAHTRVKFEGASSNLFYYSNKRKKSLPDSTASISLIVSSIPYNSKSKFTNKKMVGSVLSKLEHNGLKLSKTGQFSEKKVNGYDAYQYAIYGTKNGHKLLVYELALTHDDVMVVMLGTIRKGYKRNLKALKKLCYTIKFVE